MEHLSNAGLATTAQLAHLEAPLFVKRRCCGVTYVDDDDEDWCLPLVFHSITARKDRRGQAAFSRGSPRCWCVSVSICSIVIWTPLHPLFRVIVGIVAYAALVYLHYAFWREIASSWVNKKLAPTRYRSGVRGLVGEQAVIKEIDGKRMLSCQGDLWNYESDEQLRDGTPVEITGERGGVLIVEPIQKES